jgi:hypothetical protein
LPARDCAAAAPCHSEISVYVLIVLLLLLIASIAAAYYGARTWHWAHTTLVVLVFLAAAGFFILASETLRINAVLRNQANRLETELAQVTTRNEALLHGTRNAQVIGALAADEVAIPEDAEKIPSLADLNHQLHMVTRLRGSVWRKVTPANFDPQTGAVTVTVESPQPSGIAADTILYAFEEGPAGQPDPASGAQFLGEFRVKDVAGQQATLIPVNLLDELEQRRLTSSRGPWALYETMPIDQNEIFAGLSEDKLRELLPAESVEEYIRQGTPAGPDDDEWHVEGFDEDDNPVGLDDMGKATKKLYQRRLRDYSVEFAELNQRRVVLMANMEAVVSDNEKLKAALASAEQLGAFRDEEIRKLTIDLAGLKKERTIIDKHLATVEQQLANARRLLDQAIAENRRLADELARRSQRSSAVPAEGPLAASR